MIIGISGVAKSGKDTLFKLLNMKEDIFSRFAFADELKSDLRDLLIEKFNIDLNNCSPEEKELIRPIMVSYGVCARNIDKSFWINKISTKIQSFSNPRIPVITDVRYENEQDFIRKQSDNSKIIYVERAGFYPINEEEEKNDSKLKENSDYILRWNSFSDPSKIEEGFIKVEELFNESIKR